MTTRDLWPYVVLYRPDDTDRLRGISDTNAIAWELWAMPPEQVVTAPAFRLAYDHRDSPEAMYQAWRHAQQGVAA